MSWNTAKIEDLCTLVTSGGTPLSSVPSYYEPKEIPWLKTAEVNYCRIYETENYISKYGLSHSSAKMIPANSIIIAMYGQGDTAGRVAINKIPLCTNQACCNLIINHEIADYEYVYYYLCTLYDQFVALKTGGAQPNLNAKKIRAIEIPVPDIEAQHRIASALKAYDNLIENNQRQIRLLEEAAQRLYKEWFVDLRFPGYENTPIVDGVPERWEKAPIDSRIALLSGYAFKGAQFDSSGKYKIVTIKNVKDGEFDGSNTSRMVSIPDKMPKHCILKDGDILLSLTGNVGRTCIVNGNNYLLNQRVAKLQSDIPAFTYCLFRSRDMFDVMNNLANGVAQQNLSPVRTGKREILFPSNDLLEEFERTAGSMINKMLNLRMQCNLLIQARDRLLPKLMSGEMEV